MTQPTPVDMGQPWQEQPPPAPPRRRRRAAAIAAGVGAVAAGAALALGINAATGGQTAVISGRGSAATTSNPAAPAADMTGKATSAQQVGVVDIDTVLKYQGARAAGTGMVISSSGEVLTNNHVVNGATSIKVTIVSTGATYTATVVGTDPTDDVAVLQLQNASGLQTVRIGDSSTVAAADQITVVGNAGGVGGTPSAATGTVVATGQSLTASDENGTNSETLTDMIEINAAVISGDSGGPLYDSDGKVIGMDTAASSGRTFDGGAAVSSTVAYAIPINRALSIAAKIESGHETSTIHIGNPAFLGISSVDTVQGVAVAGVADGSPAARAGLSAGDVITSIDGTAVQSAEGVSSAIKSHSPGDRVTVTWTDTAGTSHSATVTLATGPAD
ncbi:MAG TPA: trypsin-like peptidase domain-containing protein [Jatrophihabitantaceae bacterium]|jgi:S1-C subfamily serine protease